MNVVPDPVIVPPPLVTFVLAANSPALSNKVAVIVAPVLGSAMMIRATGDPWFSCTVTEGGAAIVGGISELDRAGDGQRFDGKATRCRCESTGCSVMVSLKVPADAGVERHARRGVGLARRDAGERAEAASSLNSLTPEIVKLPAESVRRRCRAVEHAEIDRGRRRDRPQIEGVGGTRSA